MGKKASIATNGAPSAAARSQRVGDVMRRDFITITSEESLLEALQLMRLARLRHLVVVSDGVLIGILSYRDLQDQLVSGLGLGSPAPNESTLVPVTVGERMTEAPFSIDADATLYEAAARLDRLRVGCLPVVDPEAPGPRLVGLLTEMDLLRAAYGF